MKAVVAFVAALVALVSAPSVRKIGAQPSDRAIVVASKPFG